MYLFRRGRLCGWRIISDVLKGDRMGVAGDAPNEKKSASWQRRRFVVDPLFQWKYTGLAVGSVFAVSLVTSAMLFATLHQQARLRMLAPDGGNAWANTLMLMGAATIFSTGLCLAFGVWAMKLTHRVSGPLYLMGQQLSELASGRFPKQRPLRASDEFKCFYDEFWATMNQLRGRERDAYLALDRALAAAKRAVHADDMSRDIALAEIIRQLQGLRADSAELLGCDPTIESTSQSAATPVSAPLSKESVVTEEVAAEPVVLSV